MKILFIWDGNYPWDIRVEKVCNALIEDGHEIHLVCRNTRRQQRYELYKGLHIHRIIYLPAIFGRINDFFTFPAFFSPIWLWELFRIGIHHKCDLVITRDLPMALAGLFVAKTLRIPNILDMAECYPEMLRCTWQFEGFKFKNLFLRNPWIADRVEMAVLSRIDHVLVMIEESRDRLLEKNILPSKIHIVSNTPVVKRFNNTAHTKNTKIKKINSLKIVYVGLLNPSRGLDTVIEAIAKYLTRNAKIELLIIGTGKAEDKLKQQVKDLKLDDKISFKGWVDNTEIPSYILDADIGIVPHHRCNHWNTTIPNKLFDYMAAGKPVIVSDVTPMARIVKDVQCGLVYEDYNIDSLVNILYKLENEDERDKLGQNGRNSVESFYNWNNEKKHLQEVMQKIQENTL